MNDPEVQDIPGMSIDAGFHTPPHQRDETERVGPPRSDLARLEGIATRLRSLVLGLTVDASPTELFAMEHLAHAINDLAGRMRGVDGLMETGPSRRPASIDGLQRTD